MRGAAKNCTLWENIESCRNSRYDFHGLADTTAVFGACTPHYFRGLGHHGRLKQQAKHFAAQDFTIVWPPGIYEATYLGAEEFSACTNTQAKFCGPLETGREISILSARV
jgi:hypothetical protein